MEMRDKTSQVGIFILTNEFRISGAWTDLGQRGDTARFWVLDMLNSSSVSRCDSWLEIL